MSRHDVPAPTPAFVVNADEIAPVPWKNGGGLTRELLRWPPADTGTAAHDLQSPPWTLRLSLADITRDGPFSPFPGVVRWFCVLEGDGVELALPAGAQQLRPGDAPLRFDGADAPGCRLLGGPTRDLNLMLQGADGALVAAPAGGARPAVARIPVGGDARATGTAWAGYFERETRRLTWPCDAAQAPAEGWWILLHGADLSTAETARPGTPR